MATQDTTGGFSGTPGAPMDYQEYGEEGRGGGDGGNGRNGGQDRMATALGWFSIGLGLAQLVAPREVARLIGIRERNGLMRAVGLREVATGIGILTQPQPAGWLWARVAGDVMDVALLGTALGAEDDGDRSRIAAALAAVVGVGAADVIAGQQLGSPRASEERPDALSGRPGIYVQKSIAVERTPQECYAFWRDFTNLPRFMSHIESVQVIDTRLSHWVAKAPAGMRVEWDAEILDDQPGQSIRWRSLEGADVEHSGTVRFDRAPGNRGTFVRVQLLYRPPGGRLAAAVARLFGEEPRQQIPQELRRFKAILETGEVPTAEGQPAGHSLRRPRVSPGSPAAPRVANWDSSLVNP